MKIFLSHSSRQKPLVREIKTALPEHINVWIDEDRLIFGDDFPRVLEDTIRRETDYVVLFLDSTALESAWVRQEVTWTQQAEKEFRRTMLLPVIIDDSVPPRLAELGMANRKCLRLLDYQESSVKSLAVSITSELFASLCRDMQELRNPKAKSLTATIQSADDILNAYANAIRLIVFPHREANPLTKDGLAAKLRDSHLSFPVVDDLDHLLSKIVTANAIPGLVYDGYDIFLREEHAKWKSVVQSKHKAAIARRAASHIRNRMSILLDAGSTAEEIARILCTKVETRAISQLTVVTVSINIADMLSDCCVKMGFDDDYTAIDIYTPGGRVRPSTQAIVPVDTNSPRPLETLCSKLGGCDAAFLGVNGVTADHGFATHDTSEFRNKSDILKCSKLTYIVGDSSKVGLKLDHVFATLDDKVVFITNRDEGNGMLTQIASTHPGLIEWADQV